MYSDILEEAGLTPNESKIYEALLYIGESPVSQISIKSGVHRRNVYDALNRLVDKGLVCPIFQKGENIYKAVEPQKVIQIIESKKKKLEAILPDLQSMYDSDPKKEAAYIYKGIEGYKNYRIDLLRVGQETHFLGAKGLWLSKQIDESFRQQYIEPFHAQKNKHLYLFDPRVKYELPKATANICGEFKFLPESYSTPGIVDIFGDHVVTFTSVGIGNIGEDVTIFVMINPELAKTYKTWFQLIWDMLPKNTSKD